MPALRAFQRAYVAFLRVTYAGSLDVLADFGIHPKTAAPLTVDAKAVAVAKRAATRAARHTMGSQQKKGVKGAVTGVAITPIPAAPPVGSTPANPVPATPVTPAPSGGTPVTKTISG
jgi:hypothetical protein